MNTFFIKRDAKFTLTGMRETLSREWDETKPILVFIGANPGNANGERDDATARKYIGFAQRWGYGRYVAGNLYQWVATDMRELLARLCLGEPVNPADPDAWLGNISTPFDVCFAWGNAPPRCRREWASRVAEVVFRCVDMRDSGHIGRILVAARTKDNAPAHLSRLGHTASPLDYGKIYDYAKIYEGNP